MIFVATGTQFSFDRLVRYMDQWAANNVADNKPRESVVIQLGEGDYLPQHAQWERFMGLEDYNEKIKQSSVFISHAGMGNIISAKDHGVPIIVINRQASLGEHRNDHQQEGLTWMAKLEGVYAVSTQESLYHLLDQRETLQSGQKSANESLYPLINYLKGVL